MSGDNTSIGLLQECSYEGIRFPIVIAETDGGHDLVRHKAHGRRGADLEPVGQKEYTGNLQIPLVDKLWQPYGDEFTGTYAALIAMFESTPIGQLTHPTKGTFTVGIESWKEKLDPDVRNGVWLDVTWVEHNATALIDANGASNVSTSAAAADTAMAAIGG
jgi:prophage DNA circulation protein